MDNGGVKDSTVAKELCNNFSINHTIHYLNEGDYEKDINRWMKIWRKNTSFIRDDGQGFISRMLYEKYSNNYIHLKSSISEIGRGYYRKSVGFLPKYISPYILSKTYGTDYNSKFVVDAFSEYINITDFNKKTIFNYDIYDLFCWEHCMGAWQNLQLLDFDMVWDTFMLFNNRYILKMLLSVPLKYRLNNATHFSLIQYLSPEILKIPFDSKKYFSHIKKLKRFVIGISTYTKLYKHLYLKKLNG